MEFSPPTQICLVCKFIWDPKRTNEPCPQCPPPPRFVPKGPGWYWMKRPNAAPRVVHVDGQNLVWQAGSIEPDGLAVLGGDPSILWSRPLSPPTESEWEPVGDREDL